MPKALGQAESSPLSRPPPWADSLSRLSSGGPRLGRLRAKGHGPPTVDTLRELNWKFTSLGSYDHVKLDIVLHVCLWISAVI